MHLMAHGLDMLLDARLFGKGRSEALQAVAGLVQALRSDPTKAGEAAERAAAVLAKGRPGLCHALASALEQAGEPHDAATCIALPVALAWQGEDAQALLADIAQTAGLCSPGAGEDVSAAAMMSWFAARCKALGLPKRLAYIRKRDVYALSCTAAREAAHLGLSRAGAYQLLLSLMEPEVRIRAADSLVACQRDYFHRNETLDLTFRRDALLRLQQAIREREADIQAALYADLGKCAQESYMCETGMVLSELRHMLAHLARYARRQYVPTPMAQFPAVSFAQKRPFGVVLIMSPWNYPFLLTMQPLIGAIAAGNCAVVKPSAYAPSTSGLIRDILAACFPQEHVAVVEGGRAENQALLDQRFDKIFFTGGAVVGREVLRRAAAHLTPVTLELGGKSPVVVDETADIPLTARRIAFGKLLNAGQTCVAPDYVLAHRAVKNALVDALRDEFARMVGDDPLQNPIYPHLVSRKHYDRVMGLIDPARLVCGGQGDPQTLRVEPTILEGVLPTDAVMQEEIFGPVLPILEVEGVDEAIAFIRERETPLACYLFTEDRAVKRRFLRETPFGGGCVNDTIIHLATDHLPFGGMGASGMGRYHGRYSFDCFSHTAGVVDKATWLDLPMRYAPYREKMMRLVRFFLK